MRTTTIYFEHLKGIIEGNQELKETVRNFTLEELENQIFQDIETVKEDFRMGLSRTPYLSGALPKNQSLYEPFFKSINIREVAEKIKEFVKEN